jgi:Zn-dependent protease
MNEKIQLVLVFALPVLFAIALHEAAHAFAAKYFGDNTAFQQGRLTLNPMSHIDIVGTIIVPVILFLNFGIGFGYAKPVPVNFGNLRNPKRDMAWVALAGPAANFLMAFLWSLFSIGLYFFGIEEPFFQKMAKAGIAVNLAMFAFNLFPVPPLDGGRIAISLLPHQYAFKYAKLEPYGIFIVLGLAMLPFVNFWGIWMAPVMNAAGLILQMLSTPFLILVK